MRRVAPWFFDPPIAHRGLHRPGGPVENSLPAFAAAIDAGFGIELDIQPSADHEPMVFHDDTLERLTDAAGPVAARPTAALTRLGLRDGRGATIPHLADVLDLVAGRVPLFIEIKSWRRGPAPVEAAIAALLTGYDGPAAVQSFDPAIVGWFAATAPFIPRGQIATATTRRSGGPLPWQERWRRARLAYNPQTRPDFVSYDARALPSPVTRRLRRAGMPLLTWTVRDAAAARHARLHADNIIFEGFRPDSGTV